MNKHIYQLGIKKGKIKSVLSSDGTDHFVAPVTKKSKKIYLIGKDGVIHYVGITTQPIRSRLRGGENPNHATGYHGYKWLKESGKHCLVIWIFEDDMDIEAIEAEIVYYFRKQNDQWPRHQTEIHFHSTSVPERKLAKKILAETQRIVRDII